MNFIEFKNKMSPYRVFSLSDINMVFPGFVRINLSNWTKKGYLNKLRNSWYYFPEFSESENIAWLAANLIYSPSYISMHSALSYYNIIPEGIFSTTSITTNHTKIFHTYFGIMNYYKIKNSVFGFGQKLVASNAKEADNSRKIIIAELEKALLDFFYLHSEYNSEKEIIDLRLNHDILNNDLNKKRFFSYLEKYKNKELEKRVYLLIKTHF